MDRTIPRRQESQASTKITKIVIPLSILMIAALTASSEIPYATEFFQEIEGDVSKISWAHAVNSKAELSSAIEGSSMMLEADVLMGTVDGSSNKVPIMAHPPNSSSDLTFDAFLDTIFKVNESPEKRRGIKLDFKDISAVEPVLLRLEHEAEAERLSFPIWLNADVLKGPIDATLEPLNGSMFIGMAQRHLPTATLSLGWTTHYGRDELKNSTRMNQKPKTIRPSKTGYTYKNVQEMIQLLKSKSWQGPVTFAVRAGLVTPSESIKQLGRLMTETTLDSTSFTVWSKTDDPVDMNALRGWVQHIQKHQVCIDLPFDLDDGPTLVVDPIETRPLGKSDQLLSNSSEKQTGLTFTLFFSTVLVQAKNLRLSK